MEDRIRRLCAELVAATDDEEITPRLVELREALHQHIETLRERYASYPNVVERRVWNKIPSEGTNDAAKTVEMTRSD